jgi:hypothetical protein
MNRFVSKMHLTATAAAALFLAAVQSYGQTTTNNEAVATTNRAPAAAAAPASNAWSFAASAYTYIVPQGRSYVQPTFTADYGWLHLEARYNYENLETGSAWIGYNFSGGNKLSWQITPMIGGVFGNTTGVAPGYSGSLSWWKLSLYTEGEYVFDAGTRSGDFFYTWSELSCSPVDWFRFGLVVQRTKAYQTSLDIQRGFLVGFTYKQVDFTTYVFNLGWTDPTVVLAVTLNF